MTRVTQLIHDAGKYLLISVYPLPTHPTHNFTHNNGGNLETLPGWPKKLQHNRPARSAGQWGLQHGVVIEYAPTFQPLFFNPWWILTSWFKCNASPTFWQSQAIRRHGIDRLCRLNKWRLNYRKYSYFLCFNLTGVNVEHIIWHQTQPSPPMPQEVGTT